MLSERKLEELNDNNLKRKEYSYLNTTLMIFQTNIKFIPLTNYYKSVAIYFNR